MKATKTIFTLILLLFSLTVSVAAESENYYESQLEASGAEKIIDKLPTSTSKLLEEIGINGFDYKQLLDISPRKIADVFFQLLRNEYVTPMKSFFAIVATIVLFAVFDQFNGDLPSSEKTIEMLGSAAVVISMLVPLSSAIVRAASAIKLSGNVMLTMIPVLAGVIAVSGTPTLAMNYNGLAFSAAQLTSKLGASVVKPLTQLTLALGILTSVVREINLNSIVDLIKKTAIFVMSISSTLFVTMLTLKGMLASAADTIAVRGIRYLIGRLIPVVGGAISDGYYSIAGSLSLVKNTVGIYSIIAVVLINLPVLLECLSWLFFLFLASTVAELFGQDGIAAIIKSVSSSIMLLTIIVLFSAVIIILSTGLILLIRGGTA